jgi:D-beta-D-heptose 7-phosphate kinase/D-beta-D-heptose 1-phosphate adenosyltransferase
MSSKISSLEIVAEQTRALRDSKRKIVFTNGCYDVLHPGHVSLLYRARSLGDVLVVAINSDESIRRLKGPGRPIFNEDERAELLAALEMVDFVCTFSEDTPLRAIITVHPDVLVKGADWGLDGIVGRQEVEAWGGRVVALPLIEGHSTTGIVERILDRYAPHGDSRKTHP